MALQLQNLLYEARAGAAHITINRPPLNILDTATIQEMQRALDAVAADTSIDIIVWSGAGARAFSAGVEIRDHTPERAPAMLTAFHHLFLTLLDMERTTIAAVRGFCFGGGCELASFCDWVVAAEDAQFGQPEIKVGCYPPVAAAWLPRLIGYRRAWELISEGDPISAEEARRIGLINEVVPAERLDAAVAAKIERLRARSPVARRLARRALRAAQPDLRAALQQTERLYLEQLLPTEDAQEGVAAFLEKRKPDWKGR